MPTAKTIEKELDSHAEKIAVDWHGGILRMYILHRLSIEPQSGYGLMESLQATTEGAWRPGPGSVYPILKGLEKKGFVKAQTRGGRSKHVYSITAAGHRELEASRDVFEKFSYQRWQRFRGLMLEVLSPKMLAERIRGGFDIQQSMWDRILSSKDIPDKEKTFLLKEYKLQVERQLDWVSGRLLESE